MKRIIGFTFLVILSVNTYSQTKKTPAIPAKKYVLKISPVVKFNFISAKKANNDYPLPFSTMSTGFNLNFLMAGKKKNYNDIGASIEIIPVTIKKKQQIISSNGYKIGFEYNYRFVFIIKNKPNMSLFTAIGTQTNFTKLQSSTYDLINRSNIFSTKSFEQNAVITPGFQYTKKSFFFDFSIPCGIGYTFTKSTNKTGGPVLLESDTNKNYNMLNWNVGCKMGVGAKF